MGTSKNIDFYLSRGDSANKFSESPREGEAPASFMNQAKPVPFEAGKGCRPHTPARSFIDALFIKNLIIFFVEIFIRKVRVALCNCNARMTGKLLGNFHVSCLFQNICNEIMTE